VLVEINEVARDESTWPFSDRIYIYTSAALRDLAEWAAPLRPDEIEEGFPRGKHKCGPEIEPGSTCYSLWWD
jgi:hypothetical protein